MKKFIIIALVLLLSASVFATVPDAAELKTEKYRKVYGAFIPTDPKSLGMGGAGLALSENSTSMFLNPAALAGGNASVSIPSVGFSVYNVYNFAKKDSEGKTSLEKILEEVQKEEISVSAIANELVSVIGSDHGALLAADASVAFRLKGGLGLGAYVNDTIRTYSTSGALGSSLINQMNASAFIGYGYGLDLSIAKISVGATAKLNYLLFNQAVSASDILAAGDGDAMLEAITSTPIIYGYSFPVSIGAAVEFPFGLKATAVVNDLFNNMKLNVVEADKFGEEPEVTGIECKIAPTVNAGLAFSTKGFLKTNIAADIIDVQGLMDDMNSGIEANRAFLTHLNAGVELDLLNTVEARVGLSEGYMSAGASFNLLVFRVDAAYYWKEFGLATGQNPSDALSIRFNLGWER